MKNSKDLSLQKCKMTNVQFYKCAKVQMCKLTNVEKLKMCKLTNM